jgi:hypothetical protein
MQINIFLSKIQQDRVMLHQRHLYCRTKPGVAMQLHNTRGSGKG